MPTLNEFSALVRSSNVSRPYLFFVEIVKPPSLQNFSTNSLKNVNLFCYGASTPHASLFTNDDYVEFGIRRKVVYEYDFQNLVLQFYLDQAFEIKSFFDAWFQSTVPAKRDFEYPDTYTADKLLVHIVNMTNDITYTYTYNRVFVKTVHGIDLSYQSNGISTFPVEFAFETMEFSSSSNLTNTEVNQDNSTLTGTTIPGVGTIDGLDGITNAFSDGINNIQNLAGVSGLGGLVDALNQEVMQEVNNANTLIANANTQINGAIGAVSSRINGVWTGLTAQLPTSLAAVTGISSIPGNNVLSNSVNNILNTNIQSSVNSLVAQYNPFSTSSLSIPSVNIPSIPSFSTSLPSFATPNFNPFG